MFLGDRHGHLAYSTLVHPGDTWAEMRESLETYAPAVKARVSPDETYGVSLRISGASAQTLTDDPAERRRLASWLSEHDMYVFTVNAFPHGPFKGRRVMEDVYEPDWATEDRVRYTCQVADILAEITPSSVAPSIQTAPLAFRAKVTCEADVEVLTRNVLRVVAHLIEVERTTGRRVKLALEPEPACYLETTEETIAYFRERIWSASGARVLCDLTGLPVSEVVGLVRRHLGVVFDVCHQSVEFEDIAAALRQLRDAGVPIFKLQAAAALRVPMVTADVVAALGSFTDTIYLSQTTESRDGQLTRMLTLTEAIDRWKAQPGGVREWRTHFHVPVFLDDLGEFGTTRDGIERALEVHADTPLSDHLEIETYTWDVLPAHLKSGDVTDYVSRELEWFQEQLRSATAALAASVE
ncbi:metabolite traffic protein EboE [Jatrophihabitans telluris]|uniref:Metabolite traffic protein EboE n=1 Tax=Jatrophihabitans telluris TaxID=2038343 RepID=A0ABY4QVD4_9ACTN|nr:metabolite traffic protein EboE [Jatrophihabitans telluris]UQX86991.1 metabolite traffic protein EboE [Jatrophihabitans telluris]